MKFSSTRPVRVTTRRGWATVAAAVALVTTQTAAQANDEAVFRAREAKIAPGKLPAWETEGERTAPKVPRVRSMPGAPLPVPPPTGYRVPAEFEPVAAFVVSEGDWWGAELGMYFAMIEQGTTPKGAGAIVLTSQAVSSYESYLAGQGVALSRVHVVRHTAGLDAKWARDFGPISIYEQGQPGHLAFLDLHYYDKRPHDDAVAAFLATSASLNRYGLEGDDHTPPDDAKLYMEGGNFQTDGQGTCILSNDIASDNSKAGNTEADTQAKVEQILGQYGGCKKFVWLTPPPNTGTGHVDMYTKLLTPTDILLIDFPSQTGNNAQADAIIEQNLVKLQAATNLSGDPFVVHRIVIPSLGNAWTYRTYTNSVIVNHRVMVPTYGQSNYDNAALQVYATVLGPDYEIVGIDSSEIVDLGGAVHCTTMQIASACGDGTAQDLLFEDCDGTDLRGRTCATQGFADGVLACTAACAFDTSGCTGTAPDAGPEAGVDAGPDAPEQDAAGPDAPPDAIFDAVVDVGAEAHADGAAGDGSAPDAIAQLDGAADAKQSTDAPMENDSGSAAVMATEDGGCGCRTSGGGRNAGWWAMAGIALAARRRLRRKAPGQRHA